MPGGPKTIILDKHDVNIVVGGYEVKDLPDLVVKLSVYQEEAKGGIFWLDAPDSSAGNPTAPRMLSG